MGISTSLVTVIADSIDANDQKWKRCLISTCVSESSDKASVGQSSGIVVTRERSDSYSVF